MAINRSGIRLASTVRLDREAPFLIRDFVHEEATVVIARPEGGKSLLSLSMATAIYEGVGRWAEREVEKGVPVIWAMDRGQAKEISRRLKDTGKDILLTDTKMEDSDEWWWQFIADLKNSGCTILFVDNLSSLLGVTEGSWINDRDVRPITNRLNQVIDAGISVVLIHHTGKFNEEQGSQKSPMGSTQIEAWGRHFVHIEADGDYKVITTWGNDAGRVVMGFVINPFINTEDGLFIAFGGEEQQSIVEHWEGDPKELARNKWNSRQDARKKQGRTARQQAGVKAQPKAEGARQGGSTAASNGIPERILAALKDKPEGMGWNELDRAVTGASGAKSKAANSMVESGTLVRTKEGQRTVYRLAS